MSGWRQFAENIRWGDDAGTNGTKGTKPPAEAPIVPIVPIVPKAPPINPGAILRDWHRHLVALDDLEPPPGYALNWWVQAVRDAWEIVRC